MAITAFTGPPGAGKSHALVKDVIIPAVLAGRRVLSNIDGLDADAVRAYCLERMKDARTLGSVATFHGSDATKPGFWPDEIHDDADTVVKGGDLVVFDEWAMYFPTRGKWPAGCNVEPYLRWHRHLTRADGQASDVAIGTQKPTDIHQDVRALVARSYKFKKLTAVGADGQYSWMLFDGHLQPKGGHYRHGTGKYDPDVFPLYASSAAAKDGTHVELRTNKRDSIWSGWQAWAVIVGAPLLLIIGVVALWWVWSAKVAVKSAGKPAGGQSASAGGSSAPVAPAAPRPPVWRIMGQVDGPGGARVIVVNKDGTTRVMMPMTFEFEDGRPVRGTVDGEPAIASEWVPAAGSAMLGGMAQ